MIKLLTLSEEDEIVYKLFHLFSSERKWDGSLSGFWIIFRKFKKQVSLQVFWRIYRFQDFKEPALLACYLYFRSLSQFQVLRYSHHQSIFRTYTHSQPGFFSLLIHLQRIHIYFKGYNNKESELRFFFIVTFYH